MLASVLSVLKRFSVDSLLLSFFHLSTVYEADVTCSKSTIDNTGKRYETYSKKTIKTPEQCQ